MGARRPWLRQFLAGARAKLRFLLFGLLAIGMLGFSAAFAHVQDITTLPPTATTETPSPDDPPSLQSGLLLYLPLLSGGNGNGTPLPPQATAPIAQPTDGTAVVPTQGPPNAPPPPAPSESATPSDPGEQPTTVTPSGTGEPVPTTVTPSGTGEPVPTTVTPSGTGEPVPTTTTPAPTDVPVPSTTPMPPTAPGDIQIVWEELKDNYLHNLPAAQRYQNAEAQSVIVDGKIYSFGGFDYDTANNKFIYEPNDRAFVYDPKTNNWTQLASMPPLNDTKYGGSTHTGIATDGTLVYFAGGYTATSTGKGQSFGTKDVWYYDIVNNSYGFLPSLPAKRAGGTLALVGRNLYYIGGTTTGQSQDFRTQYTLNLDSDTKWREVTPLPDDLDDPKLCKEGMRGLHHSASVVYNGQIYVVGGQCQHDGRLIPQDELYRYDPPTDTWVELAHLPAPRNHAGSTTTLVGNRIWVIGGQQEHNVPTATVFIYDIPTNTWYSLPEASQLPIPRHSGFGGIIDGKIYYATGYSRRMFRGTILTDYLGQGNDWLPAGSKQVLTSVEQAGAPRYSLARSAGPERDDVATDVFFCGVLSNEDQQAAAGQ